MVTSIDTLDSIDTRKASTDFCVAFCPLLHRISSAERSALAQTCPLTRHHTYVLVSSIGLLSLDGGDLVADSQPAQVNCAEGWMQNITFHDSY